MASNADAARRSALAFGRASTALAIAAALICGTAPAPSAAAAVPCTEESLVGTWSVSGLESETYYTFDPDGYFTAYDIDDGTKCERSGTYTVQSYDGFCLGELTVDHDECEPDAVGRTLEFALTFENPDSFETESEEGVWSFTRTAAGKPTSEETASESDKEQGLALVQWTAQLRFGKDVQEGDWVRYQSAAGAPGLETELRATKRERGGMWIVESQREAGDAKGDQIHLLVDLSTLKLIEGFRIDEKGNRESAKPLPDAKVAEIIERQRGEMLKDSGPVGAPVGWAECGKAKELTGPFGTLKCDCWRAEFDEARTKGIPPAQMQAMAAWAMMYYSEDVPRLLPLVAGIMAAMAPTDDYGKIHGGLVRSSALTLTGYGGSE